jgi:hypothetical protein
MALKTILEFDNTTEDSEVYEQIQDILNRRMPSDSKKRAWITLIVRSLSSDSDIYIDPPENDASAINERKVLSNWDEAYEILCNSVDRAVEEIKTKFGA